MLQVTFYDLNGLPLFTQLQQIFMTLTRLAQFLTAIGQLLLQSSQLGTKGPALCLLTRLGQLLAGLLTMLACLSQTFLHRRFLPLQLQQSGLGALRRTLTLAQIILKGQLPPADVQDKA
ncbi:hypothetical protein SSTU70S_03700 [Stutzerimonas stutzeri]